MKKTRQIKPKKLVFVSPMRLKKLQHTRRELSLWLLLLLVAAALGALAAGRVAAGQPRLFDAVCSSACFAADNAFAPLLLKISAKAAAAMILIYFAAHCSCGKVLTVLVLAAYWAGEGFLLGSFVLEQGAGPAGLRLAALCLPQTLLMLAFSSLARDAFMSSAEIKKRAFVTGAAVSEPKGPAPNFSAVSLVLLLMSCVKAVIFAV